MNRPVYKPHLSLLLYRGTGVLLWLTGLWGLAMAVLPVRPFWIDEWRLIWNLKFKTLPELWGPLEYTQQFPRLYLSLLKGITSAAHYSYASLRLPALLVAVYSMVLAWRLMCRLFPDAGDMLRLLFPLIIVSSQVFTDYIVQTKHYEMELFLAILVLWQGVELIQLSRRGIRSRSRYVMLCLSMLLAPPFSYTYPIAIAPLLAIGSYKAFGLLRKGNHRRAGLLLLPLLCSLCGISVFYITDVSQLMADEEMHRYWAYRMASVGLVESLFRVWYFFAALGAGAVFEVIFGALGITAFGAATIRSRGILRSRSGTLLEWLQMYSVGLVVLVLLLFATGRLPLGEAKFNAFCVPAMSLLIVVFLQWLRMRAVILTCIISVVLYAGLAGNLVTVFYNAFFAPEYARRMAIYRVTEKAILQAQRRGAPLYVTPDVAWPDEIVHVVPHLKNMTADAVLKTWPAYDMQQALPVTAVRDTAEGRHLALSRGSGAREAMVGDGLRYEVLRK